MDGKISHRVSLLDEELQKISLVCCEGNETDAKK